MSVMAQCNRLFTHLTPRADEVQSCRLLAEAQKHTDASHPVLVLPEYYIRA